jgi:hypothetical protein
MILPTKHLRLERSLIGVGGEILLLLDDAKTVSRLWDDFRRKRESATQPDVGFDRFVLALDMLFAIGAVNLERERISRRGSQ